MEKSKKKAKAVVSEETPKEIIPLLAPTKEQLDIAIGVRGPDYQALVKNASEENLEGSWPIIFRI
jgi:hypothetical protein